MLPLPDWAWTSAEVILGAAAILYGGFPLIIKNTLTLKGRPTIEPIPVGRMPAEVYAHFGQSAVGLQACGFAIRTYIHIPDQVPNAEAYLALWINEQAGQQATAVVLYAHPANGPVSVKHYIEFMTKLADGDGFCVLTNNSSGLRSFKTVATKNTLWCVPTQDVQQLYHLHLFREAQLCRMDAARYLPAAGEDVEVMADGIEFDLRRQVGTGYLYEDERKPNLFRPTWMGAYRMTWAELPPMKGMRQRKAMEQARHSLWEALQHPLRPPQGVRLSHKSPYKLPPRRLTAFAA